MDTPYIFSKLKNKKTEIFTSTKINEIKSLRDLSQPLFTLRKKTLLITERDKFNGLYLVHSGLLKQSHIRKPGESEIITHFFLPGDIIGLDSICEHHYCGPVTSIETSSLSLIKFRNIDEYLIAQENHNKLLRVLSRSIRTEHARLWRTLSQPSDARLAYFLITMSNKFSELGYSPNAFRLAMSRQEIANYLCMASETVSRIISRFENEGLLSANRHDYFILDPIGLATIAKKNRSSPNFSG
ncbi:Crp/Fnr family transcriptional regulator [Vreelandella andesensis]|uniref:Crp/Fnr family transcriptional regulator n=1 Tax=Vreelandella andesensis TaxID=447567 RepID=UPI00142E7020|nr:helix-turn-helix domain-containing protein [Halomonas andesensis]